MTVVIEHRPKASRGIHAVIETEVSGKLDFLYEEFSTLKDAEKFVVENDHTLLKSACYIRNCKCKLKG
ncbi:MAG TPA: hypothetical protein PKK26_19220 [Candidatus Wallbacteria bacterium]|nr:hypothetical protein [Candidatus Wallbacteria bacterium]